MFRALPLFSWRQALLILVPLLLLIPLAWLAQRGEEQATARQFRVVLEREPARFEARIRALLAEDLEQLDRHGLESTLSPLGDFVHVSKEGRLLQPRAVEPSLSPSAEAPCLRLLHDKPALAALIQQPLAFAAQCPTLRGPEGSLIAPFALIAHEEVDALKRWLERYRDMLRDEERTALMRELASWRDTSAARSVTETVRAADRAISAVEAPFEEARFRTAFASGGKRLEIRTSHAWIALTQLEDGSYAGTIVHALTLARASNLARLGLPAGVRMHILEGSAGKPTESTSWVTLAPELHARFSLDQAYVDRQSARSATLFRVWALALAAGVAGFAMLLAYQGAQAKRLAAIRIDYLAAVAHELRTPMATLSLLADVLAQNLDAPEERSEIASNLRNATQRLTSTMERMLTLQRTSQDGFRADRKVTRLKALVERIASELPVDAARPLQLSLEDVEAHVDVALFTTAVVNLLANAERYGAAQTELSLQRGTKGIELRVMDRGPGVPDSEKQRIFEAFARGTHNTLSKGNQGLGIGLALVRLFATTHGGTVRALDREGGGATFLLTFRSEP